MRNRFYTWYGTQDRPEEIHPGEIVAGMPPGDAKYHVGVMAYLDQMIPDAGLKMMLTWRPDDFDEIMKDAVIVLAGDEKSQIPSYQRKVRAIFKTMGYWRNPLAETLQLPFPIAWRALLRDARNSALNLKRRFKYGPPGEIKAQLYEIPLGYYSVLDIPFLPFEQRQNDVFFAGFCNPRGWSLRVQYVARQQMAAAVEAARNELPQCQFEWRPQRGGFGQGLNAEQYSRALANAKIALSPRGIVDETFRFIEAAKMGCIVISEPVASRWYFRECPAIFVRKWSELPKVLAKLLADPAGMADLSLRTRQWYESTISEPAIAKYMAEKLTHGPTD